MSLKQATVEQLVQWQSDIVAELASRAGHEPQVAAPPWASAQAAQPQAPRPARRPQIEPPKRVALGAGMNGHGEEVISLASIPRVDYPPAPRPPGMVWETGATDPELAARFRAMPSRFDGVPAPAPVEHHDGEALIGPSDG
jgi:hypothetical protein